MPLFWETPLHPVASRVRLRARALVLVLGLILAVGVSQGAGKGEPGPVYKTRVELGDQRADMVRLTSMDLDIDAVFYGWARVYLVQPEIDRLRALGFQVTVLPDNGPLMAELARRTALEPRTNRTVPSTYHTYTTLTAELQQVAADHPNITRLMSIGTSVQGRELWMMKITRNPDLDEYEPEVAYISSMHGDEVVGKEMLVNLIHHLTDNYPANPRVAALVDTTEMWIMPSMNPDGTELGQRYNASGYDLNRNFPDQFVDPVNTATGRQPETAAIMNWAPQHTLTLSANMHGGALVANYPFDSNPSGSSVFSPTPAPDHDLFVSISRTYADNNPPMAVSNSHPAWDNGITNGADWYSINGGMQDWEYVWTGGHEILLELSNTKWPAGSTLPQFWTDNQESLLAFFERVHEGVRGIVTGSDSGLPLEADVLVDSNPFPVFTDPDAGDYHRLLLPGTYTLTFSATGYQDAVVPGVLVGSGAPTELNVAMVPLPVDLEPLSHTVEDAGNGWFDPGETTDVSVVLANLGRSATDVEADLVPTGWYGQVMRPQASYPDISNGLSGQSLAPHHEIYLPPSIPTGQKVGYALRWNTAEGSGLSQPFFMEVGPPAITVSTATDVPQQVASYLTTHSEIVVPGGAEINDVKIDIDLSHPYIEELQIELTSPQGTQVTLHDLGGAGTVDIVGTYGDDLVPVDPLSVLSGENSGGTWILDVVDTYLTHHGMLNSWAVEVDSRPAETVTPEMRFKTLAMQAGDVRLDWWPYPGLATYKVYRSTDPTAAGFFVDVTSQDGDDSDTTFVDTASDPLVFYLVTGVGPLGEGPKGH